MINASAGNAARAVGQTPEGPTGAVGTDPCDPPTTSKTHARCADPRHTAREQVGRRRRRGAHTGHDIRRAQPCFELYDTRLAAVRGAGVLTVYVSYRGKRIRNTSGEYRSATDVGDSVFLAAGIGCTVAGLTPSKSRVCVDSFVVVFGEVVPIAKLVILFLGASESAEFAIFLHFPASEKIFAIPSPYSAYFIALCICLPLARCPYTIHIAVCAFDPFVGDRSDFSHHRYWLLWAERQRIFYTCFEEYCTTPFAVRPWNTPR